MDVTTDKLMHDLRAVVGDAEDLLKVNDITHAAEARARECAADVDKRVHDHPWTAIAIAAGVGLAVGILLGRK